MDKDLALSFDWMWKNEVCAHVDVYKNPIRVEYENFTEDRVNRIYDGRPITVDQLNDFLEERCWSRNRADIKEILEEYGLKGYNPLDICRKTHGRMYGDFAWIKFDDEPDLKWEDLK